MRVAGILVLLIVAAASAAACSSSSSNLGCSCSVTVNGDKQDLACGERACVGGTTATCGANGGTTFGDPCSAATGTSSGSSGTSGGTSGGASGATSNGCILFSCSTTKDCGGIAPCFSTNVNKNFCFEQEASEDDCSKGTSPTTRTTSNGPTTICVPAGCPAPVSFLQ